MLQWLCSSKYWLDKAFLIMGGLGLDKQIKKVLCRYSEGSRESDRLALSSVISNNDSKFLCGSFITRTRFKCYVLII